MSAERPWVDPRSRPSVACRCGSEDWGALWYETGGSIRVGPIVVDRVMAFDRWACSSCGRRAPGEAGLSRNPRNVSRRKGR